MPCEWYRTADGATVHIHRGRTRGRRMMCKFCRASYRDDEGKQCDFPIAPGKTCDAEMCRNCAVTLGYQETEIAPGIRRLGDTIDLCPIHRTQAYVLKGGGFALLKDG